MILFKFRLFSKKALNLSEFQSKIKAPNSLNAVAHERNSKLKFRSLGAKRFASFCALILRNFYRSMLFRKESKFSFKTQILGLQNDFA